MTPTWNEFISSATIVLVRVYETPSNLLLKKALPSVKKPLGCIFADSVSLSTPGCPGGNHRHY
jgi:hypothetical protein